MAADNVAAWAQAWISGVAIIVSGAIAVFVPWNERRLLRRKTDNARLDVECTRSSSGGLQLLITYVPEFHNHALSASVQLLKPVDARVYKGELNRPIDDPKLLKKNWSATALADNVRYNAVPLLRDGNTNNEVHRGVMYIEWPDEREGPGRAEIIIDVLQHGNHLIARQKMEVSPIDVAYWVRGAPVAVIDKR